MTLCELFTPLITYLVNSRCEAARGHAPDQEVLMSHLMRELARIRKTGAAARELPQEALEDACRYSAFYIDYMVHEGAFPYAQQWQDLGRSRYNELAGDEKFFDYMRRWLDEDTPMAHEHLRLMYDMVASGFSGSLERRSVRLEELMRRAAERLAVMPEEEASKALLRQGSEAVSRPIRARRPVLSGLFIGGAGAAALLLACVYYLHSYRSATDALRSELSETQELIEDRAMRHALNADTLVAGPVSVPGGEATHESSPLRGAEIPPALQHEAAAAAAATLTETTTTAATLPQAADSGTRTASPEAGANGADTSADDARTVVDEIPDAAGSPALAPSEAAALDEPQKAEPGAPAPVSASH